LLGFAICLVVGALVAFIVVASHAVLTSPRDGAIDGRLVICGALGFAILCDVVRARRRPRVPRVPRASLR
jgi:hypothetical protein